MLDTLEPGASPVPANEPAAVVAPTPEPSPPAPGFHDEETKPYTAGMLKAATTQPAESATPLSTGPVFEPARFGNDLGQLMPTTPIETPANPTTPVAPPARTEAPKKSFWQRLQGK